MFKKNSTFSRTMQNLTKLMLCYTIFSMTSAFAFKMGVIDGQVLMNTPEIGIEEKQKQIINEYYPKLMQLQKEYASLEESFNKNEALMDDATRKEKQAKLIQIAESMQAVKQKTEQKAFRVEQETTQKLSDISTKIAKKYGFDVVLSLPTKGGYVSKEADMTQEALKMLKKTPAVTA